ncbi:hypothetical protein C8F04DRAFT_1118024, partial [Mycena alexandri]
RTYLARWRCWRSMRRWTRRFRCLFARGAWRSFKTPLHPTPHPPPSHHHSAPLRRPLCRARHPARCVGVAVFVCFNARSCPSPRLKANHPNSRPPCPASPRAARPPPRAGAAVRGATGFEEGSGSPCTQHLPRARSSRAFPSPLRPCPSPPPRRPDQRSPPPLERLRYSCPAPMPLPPRHPQVEAQQNQPSIPTSHMRSSSCSPPPTALLRQRRGARCLTWRAR